MKKVNNSYSVKGKFAYLTLQKGTELYTTIFDAVYINRVQLKQWHVNINKYGSLVAVETNSAGGGGLGLHKLIFGSTNIPKGFTIDHKDRDPLNNRRSNLRLASAAQNAHNTGLKKVKKTSKYKGVCRKNNLWYVQITHLGIKISLGYFTREIEAARKYDLVATYLRGSFAVTNKKLGLYE